MTILSIVEPLSERVIVEAGVRTVQAAIERIQAELESNPLALDRLWNRRLQKNLLTVDLVAEREAREFLHRALSGRVEIRGEESTLAPVIRGSLAALLDMLDGSDLLERGLGNWCSSLVLFDLKRPKIVTAVVGLDSKTIYYTQHSRKGCVFRMRPTRDQQNATVIERVGIARREIGLRDASIAFYGQKASSLMSVLESRGLVKRLRQLARETTHTKNRIDAPMFRIYNLGGNPMMVSLIEGKIDAVIELRGQRCHDVVPGFVIALRAGAVLKDLNGTEITEDDLAHKLADPEHRFQYVLACNDQLGTDLIGVINNRLPPP